MGLESPLNAHSKFEFPKKIVVCVFLSQKIFLIFGLTQIRLFNQSQQIQTVYLCRFEAGCELDLLELFS